MTAPKLVLEGTADVEALCAAFTGEYSRVYSPEAAFPAGGINVECFYLTASVISDDTPLSPAPAEGPEPSAAARLDSRPACFDPKAGHRDTPVFDWVALRPGNTIAGPALIEAPDTTYVVEPGWTYRMDALRNGILERA